MFTRYLSKSEPSVDKFFSLFSIHEMIILWWSFCWQILLLHLEGMFYLVISFVMTLICCLSISTILWPDNDFSHWVRTTFHSFTKWMITPYDIYLSVTFHLLPSPIKSISNGVLKWVQMSKYSTAPKKAAFNGMLKLLTNLEVVAGKYLATFLESPCKVRQTF